MSHLSPKKSTASIKDRGLFGKCAFLPGSFEGRIVTDRPFRAAGLFTVEVTVQPLKRKENYYRQRLVGTAIPRGTAAGGRIRLNSGWALDLLNGKNGLAHVQFVYVNEETKATETLNSSVPIRFNHWSHLAVVVDQELIWLVVNGIATRSVWKAPLRLLKRVVTLRLGVPHHRESIYYGLLDEVRLSDESRAVERIQAAQNARLKLKQ